MNKILIKTQENSSDFHSGLLESGIGLAKGRQSVSRNWKLELLYGARRLLPEALPAA